MPGPTTLGTHLRGYEFGHVRQLDAVASRLLVNLAQATPLLGGAGQVAYLDIDDTIRATHGYAKQGTGYGYTGVKGLNVQVATLTTPTAAPVIVGTRLRNGNSASAHGAPRLIGDAVSTATKAGATGMVTVRADSAYYNHDVIAATTSAGARFSVTARMDRAVTAAITRIPAGRVGGYPVPAGDLGRGRATVDLRGRSRRGGVHRVHLPPQGPARHRPADRAPGHRRNPKSVPAGQEQMFTTHRHHGVFTNSPLSMLAAEASHRDHAIVEQVIADLKSGPAIVTVPADSSASA